MRKQTRLLTYSALMCALIIISTLFIKFTIPGTDILFTTQVFFILLCGQVLPPKYCIYSICTYLFLGLVGLPVFSAVSGLMVLITPSFGYLLGFPIAAAVEASLLRRRHLLKHRLAASFLSLLTLYAAALCYIAALSSLYMKTPIGFDKLMSAYCLAFLPFDLVKAVLAAYAGSRLEKPLGITWEA